MDGPIFHPLPPKYDKHWKERERKNPEFWDPVDDAWNSARDASHGREKFRVQPRARSVQNNSEHGIKTHLSYLTLADSSIFYVANERVKLSSNEVVKISPSFALPPSLLLPPLPLRVTPYFYSRTLTSGSLLSFAGLMFSCRLIVNYLDRLLIKF